MASYPTFDNRWFNSGVGAAKFDQIFPTEAPDGGQLDPDLSALTNRAIQGQYNMGSSFKPFTAYAALATGRLGPTTTYNDQGTYKLTSIADDVCAEGVRCVFRNSTCPVPLGEPCRYGTVNVTTALAVSSDTFFYKLGEEFYNTPGTQLQDQVGQFGFGADTGIDLPFEFDGRVPTNELKAQLVENSVLAQGETPNLQPGDLLQMAIGQGLMAATPLQLAVGYGAIANGGYVLTPHVVQAIYAPETPDGEPGFADLAQATLVQQIAPAARDIPMTEELRESDRRRPAPQRHRARHERPLDDGRGAVPGLPGRTPSRSPARPAPPRGAAATRGTTPRRSPPTAGPGTPVHRRLLPGEGRVRLDRRGARRQVHVPGPVGDHAAGPGGHLRAARHDLRGAGRADVHLADVSCMNSSNAGTVFPLPTPTVRPQD